MAEEDQRHRLVVLGAGRVGKTAIIQRFLNSSFPRAYKPTVEDLHCRDYNINGSIIRVDVLDTAGDLVFPAMRRLSISTAHAFMLVFAINDAGSFQEVRAIWEQVKEQRAGFQELPCVIVGNKLDREAERQVAAEEAIDWLRTQGRETVYLEVSARDDQDVGMIFQKLLDQANIPEVRKLEPMLKRRLSANSSHLQHSRERLRSEESKLGRSRSLMRRSNKPKVKQGDPTKNDCSIS